jgi:hypothetical protein
MSEIDYTSRDFTALRSDIIQLINSRTGYNWDPTDYSDLGNVLVESFAYMGDIMSHYIDRVANETSVSTAIKRETLLNFANLYGYKPSGPTPATVDVIFTNVSDQTIDIPAGTQVMAPLSYGPFSEVYFETDDAKVAIIPGQSITVGCTEGKTVNTDRPDLINPTYNKPLPANIGLSTGLPNQNFAIPYDTNIIDKSLIVYVGQGIAFAPWAYVDNLLESGPEELVFSTLQNTDGTLNIVFGDNITGAIPPSNQLISAIYKTSTGSSGNVIANSIKELTFIPGNIDPQARSYFTVTNSTPAMGGADADNTTQLKNKITAVISTRRRAVTLKDYENLALTVPRVGKTKADAAYYSSVIIYVQSQNDPTTSTPGVGTNPRVITAVASGTPSAGSVTYTTETDHGYVVDDVVTITKTVPAVYNKTGAQITAVTSNTFTIVNDATGSFVSNGLVVNLKPTSSWESLALDVNSYLADKIPVGTTVTVLSPTYVPVYMALNVTVSSSQSALAIKQLVYAALIGTNGVFGYDNNPFGRKITLSQIYTSVSKASTGITDVEITAMNVDGGSGHTNLSFASNEIPYLTIGNLTINIIGGV